MSLLDRWRERREDRTALLAEEAEVDNHHARWIRACEGAGLVREVDTVTGPTVIHPRLVHIVLGPPTIFTVQLQPGMVVDDVRKLTPRLAPHLHCWGLRVDPIGHGDFARIGLLGHDPLAATLPLDRQGGSPSVVLGWDEAGQAVTVDPVDLPHVITQGQTRSGKSTWLYSLLSQLAQRGDVLVAGVDPSGLTLRPFADTHHADWQSLGLASLDAIEKTLAGLVAEMDGRLGAMPLGRDVLPTGPGNPLTVVVLEELPATYRAMDAVDSKQGKRVRALIARLLAESHKVGFRLILAAQRAEATIVGAAERAQCGGRLSFRVDSTETVKLLHSDADDYIVGHTSAPPGIALMSWPGRPLARIRAPYVDYATFCATVTGGAE